MGGFGSGRYSRYSTKRTVEECCALDIRGLHRDGSLTRSEFTLTWRGQRGVVGRLSFRRPLSENVVLVQRAHASEPLTVEWVACRFGGQRPWWRCAGCGTRRAVLYDTGAKFRCRQCLGLTYRTQQENRGDRFILKAKRLAVRLGGDGRGMELPDKPAGMHWRTYDRLTSQFVAAYVAGLDGWQEELGRMVGALGKRDR